MVEAKEEERDESEWPSELVSLERLFTASYQQQLARLVEEHALEMAETKADYDAKLAHLVKEYSVSEYNDCPERKYVCTSGSLKTKHHDHIVSLMVTR